MEPATQTANKSSAFSLRNILPNMLDPAWVKAVALEPTNINPNPWEVGRLPWGDLSLAHGYPGLLLFFSQVTFHRLIEEGEAVSHAYVLKIKEAIETEGIADLSLFGGVTGICFALQQASFGGTRYQTMLEKLHAFLLERVDRVYIAPLKRCRRDGIPSSPRFYDPIQGVTGIGRYALENLHSPPFLKLVQEIALTLVSLCQPFSYKNQRTPGWYLASTDALNIRHRSTYPKGNFNLGLAHGVTGVLAFLSIAALRGIEVKGQKEAISSIAAWLRNKSYFDQTILWPYMISWEEEMEGKPPTKKRAKDAWCYGVPGIARTLFLAGKALQDEELKTFAATAFRGIFCRTQEEWELPGPSLCHGISGLLLITQEMAKEKGCEDLLSQEQKLRKILLSFYQPEAVWGFKDIESCKTGTCALNKPGFLEGAVGILLTLLSNANFDSKWHLPLMIHA